METLRDRLDAIDLLLKHEYASPAVILMRPIVEHMLNAILIDRGLWDEAVSKSGGNGRAFPKLFAAYRTLKERRELAPVFGADDALLALVKKLGDRAAHNNSEANLPAAKGCRQFLDAFLSNFAEKYPDEQYFHNFVRFSKPLIEVTRIFIGKTVTLKAKVNGCYLSVNKDSPTGDMLCQVTLAQAWEEFATAESYDGNIGLRGVNGKWLSANVNDGAELLSNGRELSGWERFRVYKSGDNYYIQSVQNGNLVVANVRGEGEAVRVEAVGRKADNKNAFQLDFW
ncbi:MAG: hypothetical protein IKN96_08590 [Oscillibacter sp.]|nr:hypothetical protein [Oscillibacter sp.]